MAWSMENDELGLDVKIGVVHPATDTYAAEAVEALKAGKVIAVPTDTLYGFACDAWYVCYFNLCLKLLAYIALKLFMILLTCFLLYMHFINTIYDLFKFIRNRIPIKHLK